MALRDINEAWDSFSQNLNVLSVKDGRAWGDIKPVTRVFKRYGNYIDAPSIFEDISNKFKNIQNKIQYHDKFFQEISSHLKDSLNLKTIKVKNIIKDFCSEASDSYFSNSNTELLLDFSCLSVNEFKALDFLISSGVFLFKVYGPNIKQGQVRYKEYNEDFKFKIDEANLNDIDGVNESKLAKYINFLSDTNKKGFFLKFNSIKQLTYNKSGVDVYNPEKYSFDDYEAYTKYQSLIKSEDPEVKNLFLPKSLVFGFDIELVKFLIGQINTIIETENASSLVSVQPESQINWELRFEANPPLNETILSNIKNGDMNMNDFKKCSLVLIDSSSDEINSYELIDMTKIRPQNKPNNALCLLHQTFFKSKNGFIEIKMKRETYETLYRSLNLNVDLYKIIWEFLSEKSKSMLKIKFKGTLNQNDLKKFLNTNKARFPITNEKNDKRKNTPSFCFDKNSQTIS
ncbi:MAG: hypothetical protein MK033_08760 [Candidatus Caenarcaniphilales bacterium]|nr:hypothetical protein [Candidatus Caenarcaniphilales bacterium]